MSAGIRARNDRRRPLRLFDEDRPILAAMPASYRAILAAASMIYEGRVLTMAEISQRQGLPVGTVKSRLHRARSKLQQGRARQDAEWLRARGVPTNGA